MLDYVARFNVRGIFVHILVELADERVSGLWGKYKILKINTIPSPTEGTDK